jgi:hypothetical protein
MNPDNYLIEKSQMILAIEQSIESGRGIAIGKLGRSEQLTLLFNQVLKKQISLEGTASIRSLYVALKFHAERQTGIFPTDLKFLSRYVDFYERQVNEIDFIGLFGFPNEVMVTQSLSPATRFIKYTDTEPDRSDKYDPSRCYLPLFKNKKILIVAPFANFAKQRGKKEIFEQVWHKIDAQWFEPGGIEAVQIPYSFIGQTTTFDRFSDSLSLYEHTTQKIDSCDYDVALIAAGSLALPLAAHIKQRSKVAISLGGHLQTLFGILGERWVRDITWSEKYINEHWVRLPDHLIPSNAGVLADEHAYW